MMIVIIVRLIVEDDQDCDILWERSMINDHQECGFDHQSLMLMTAPIVILLMTFRIKTSDQ